MSLDRIFTAIENQKCLAFLGAGASTGFRGGEVDETGLPSGGDLAKMLAQECGYKNGAARDLSRVAEYFIFKDSGSRDRLERLLRDAIFSVTRPRPIHTALAQLTPIKIVLTSNYDCLFEHALQKYGRRITKHVYNPNDPRNAHFQGSIFFDERDLIPHKMHGSIDEQHSMVITRSDYIHYLATLTDLDRGMPEYFRKTMIPQHTLLFLGYSLEDWNFQVIWEGVLASRRNVGATRESFAIVKQASEFQKSYWMQRRINIIEYDLTDFAVRMARRFNLEIPQLGVAKTSDGGGA